MKSSPGLAFELEFRFGTSQSSQPSQPTADMIAFAHCLASQLGQEITRAGISSQGPITINIQLPDHLASSSSTLPTVVVQPSSHTQIPPTQLPPPHSSRAFGSEDETRDDIGS
ncbi:hypothetical protein Dimus_038380 [Dionaea muscipula]